MPTISPSEFEKTSATSSLSFANAFHQAPSHSSVEKMVSVSAPLQNPLPRGTNRLQLDPRPECFYLQRHKIAAEAIVLKKIYGSMDCANDLHMIHHACGDRGLNRESTRGWAYRRPRFSSCQMTACPSAVNHRLLFAYSLRPEQRGVAMHDLEHAHTIPIGIAIGE